MRFDFSDPELHSLVQATADYLSNWKAWISAALAMGAMWTWRLSRRVREMTLRGIWSVMTAMVPRREPLDPLTAGLLNLLDDEPALENRDGGNGSIFTRISTEGATFQPFRKPTRVDSDGRTWLGDGAIILVADVDVWDNLPSLKAKKLVARKVATVHKRLTEEAAVAKNKRLAAMLAPVAQEPVCTCQDDRDGCSSCSPARIAAIKARAAETIPLQRPDRTAPALANGTTFSDLAVGDVFCWNDKPEYRYERIVALSHQPNARNLQTDESEKFYDYAKVTRLSRRADKFPTAPVTQGNVSVVPVVAVPDKVALSDSGRKMVPFLALPIGADFWDSGRRYRKISNDGVCTGAGTNAVDFQTGKEVAFARDLRVLESIPAAGDNANKDCGPEPARTWSPALSVSQPQGEPAPERARKQFREVAIGETFWRFDNRYQKMSQTGDARYIQEGGMATNVIFSTSTIVEVVVPSIVGADCSEPRPATANSPSPSGSVPILREGNSGKPASAQGQVLDWVRQLVRDRVGWAWNANTDLICITTPLYTIVVDYAMQQIRGRGIRVDDRVPVSFGERPFGEVGWREIESTILFAHDKGRKV